MNIRKSKVKIEWNEGFAYAIGLIASDGNLSSNGRNFNLTSKDLENVENFRACLGVTNKIGMKSRGGETEKKYYRIQIGDTNFYDFLNSIGLTKAKSKTIQKVYVPYEFFRDFLRGCVDGDGSISWSIHPESNQPQLRLRLASASRPFLEWVKDTVTIHLSISGGWIQHDKRCESLCYGKADSLKILDFMYYTGVRYYLKRKYRLTDIRVGGEMVNALRLGRSEATLGGSSPLPRTR